MSKAMLIGVIGAAVVVVAALAVLTPTVIVNDANPHVVLMAAVAPPQFAPPGLTPAPPGGGPQSLPGLPQQRPFGRLRACFGKQGFGRPGRVAPPDLRGLRKALKACLGAPPGAPPGP